MNLPGIGEIIGGVGKIADDLFTSDEERLTLELKQKELEDRQLAREVGLVQGQLEINKAEAQHKSIFVAGWRPFIGWVGGLALAYQFLLYPLLVWIWAVLQANGTVPANLEPPPTFDANVLFTIVTGMLGIGGMRSFDKLKKTDTTKVTRN